MNKAIPHSGTCERKKAKAVVNSSQHASSAGRSLERERERARQKHIDLVKRTPLTPFRPCAGTKMNYSARQRYTYHRGWLRAYPWNAYFLFLSYHLNKLWQLHEQNAVGAHTLAHTAAEVSNIDMTKPSCQPEGNSGVLRAKTMT